jgi:hypothetical protein
MPVTDDSEPQDGAAATDLPLAQPASAPEIPVDHELLNGERKIYALAMRFVGVILLLAGIGLLYMQCKFVVRAHHADALGRIGWHMAVILEFVLLYVFLGVMAVRLYSWATYFMTGILAVVLVYSVYSTLTGGPKPDLLWAASIGITVFIAALAATSLLVVLKARKIRALGFDPRGDGKPPERALAGSIFTGVLLLSIGATFAGMLAADAGAGGGNPGKSGAPTRPAVKWQRVSIDKGSFSVEMPGKPILSTQVQPTPHGTIKIKMLSFAMKDVEFALCDSMYPEGFVEAMGPDAQGLMDKSRDALVKQFTGKVRTDKKLQVAGFPARDVIVQFTHKRPQGETLVRIRMRMILANRRMYIAQAVHAGKPDAEVKKDVDRFFESVRVTVKKEARSTRSELFRDPEEQ